MAGKMSSSGTWMWLLTNSISSVSFGLPPLKLARLLSSSKEMADNEWGGERSRTECEC